MFYESKRELVAISNTGPIISVFQCGRVDLLQKYFKTIHIPKSEMEEFERHNVVDFAEDLIDLGLFQVHNLTDDEQEKAKKIAERVALLSKIKDPQHHLVEAEAIVLFFTYLLRSIKTHKNLYIINEYYRIPDNLWEKTQRTSRTSQTQRRSSKDG